MSKRCVENDVLKTMCQGQKQRKTRKKQEKYARNHRPIDAVADVPRVIMDASVKNGSLFAKCLIFALNSRPTKQLTNYVHRTTTSTAHMPFDLIKNIFAFHALSNCLNSSVKLFLTNY